MACKRSGVQFPSAPPFGGSASSSVKVGRALRVLFILLAVAQGLLILAIGNRYSFVSGVKDGSEVLTTDRADEVDGVVREPIDLAVYLSAPFAGTEVVAPPNGLEMISYKSAWKCIPDGFVSPQMSHCPTNAKTRLVLEFPHCWNGESLQFNVDDPHVVSASDECPASHPVVLPQMQMEVRYDMSDLDDLRAVSFSSGDITSVHGDVLFAWKQDILQIELQDCISRGIMCGITWSTEVGA